MVIFCHTCKLCDDELAAGNDKVSINFEKRKLTGRHAAFNAPITKVGKWSHDNIEKTVCRNEIDTSTSTSTPFVRAGVKPRLEKLNENINVLKAKNHALRATSKRTLDDDAMRKNANDSSLSNGVSDAIEGLKSHLPCTKKNEKLLKHETSHVTMIVAERFASLCRKKILSAKTF